MEVNIFKLNISFNKGKFGKQKLTYLIINDIVLSVNKVAHVMKRREKVQQRRLERRLLAFPFI